MTDGSLEEKTGSVMQTPRREHEGYSQRLGSVEMSECPGLASYCRRHFQTLSEGEHHFGRKVCGRDHRQSAGDLEQNPSPTVKPNIY